MPLGGGAANGGAPVAPAHGALGSTGTMSGLDASLIRILRNYAPGDEGINGLDDQLRLVLAVPEWAWFTWVLDNNFTATAGLNGNTVLWTVPADTRALLSRWRMQRDSGDNLVSELRVTHPGAYTEPGDNSTEALIRMVTVTSWIFWPDSGGIQDYNSICEAPVLLEPGTMLEAYTNGTGVSNTQFQYTIRLKLTKIIPVRPPQM